MHKPTTFAVVLLAAATSSALADPPRWCATPGAEQPSSYSLDDAFSTEYLYALPALAYATCWPTADAAAKSREIAAARAKWGKQLDVADDDWGDVLIWSKRMISDRSNPGVSFLDADAKRPMASLSPIEQLGRLTSISRSLGDDASYEADAFGPLLTEVGRLGYIERCIGSKNPIEWAMCQGDIDAFDHGKFVEQVRNDHKASAYSRIAMRVAYDQITRKLAQHAADVKALVASDPAYGKMFEIAAAQREVFANVDPTLVELAAAMDDARRANSNRAYEGCEDKVWKAWQTAVAAVPASGFAVATSAQGPEMSRAITMAAARTIEHDPAAYLASIALVTCAGRNGSNGMMQALVQAAHESPGARGPRTLAASAIYGAGLQLDDRDAKLAPIQLERHWVLRGSSHDGYGRGIVASVTKTDDGLQIEFAETFAKALSCTKEVETGRIGGFDTAGRFYYEKKCLEEKMVTYETTPAPVTVDAHFVAGIKPGAVVLVYGGAITAVWPKNGAKTPSYVFGVPVK
jgi:hypothetical protein